MERSAEKVLSEAVTDLVGSDGVALLVGVENTVEFASPAALALLGRSETDSRVFDWVGLTPQEYRARDDDAMRQTVQAGTSGWFSKEFLRPDGMRVAVEVLVIALRRNPLRWLAVLRPATAPAGGPPERPELSAATRDPVPVAGALLRLARRLAGTGTTTQVFTVVDRLLGPALGAATATMALLDPDSSTLRIHHDPGAPPELRDRWIDVPVGPDTLLGDAAHRGGPLVVDGLDELRTRYPAQGADAARLGLTVLAAVPLRADDDQLLGVLGAGWRHRDHVDVELLQTCADLVGNAIALARSVEFDHRAVSTFQQMLLPSSSALHSRYEVAVRYRAVDEVVGGDFYDVIERDQAVWLVVGDVVGHGLGAARTMGKVRFFLRALSATSSTATALLESLNELLRDERQSEIVTCLVVRFEPATARLAVATAGHPAPIVLRTAERPVQLEVPPLPPLGVEGWPEGRDDLVVPAPERLVAFTDGLVERRGEIVDVGVGRLIELLDTHEHLAVEALADLLLESDLATTDDDAAVLCVRLDREHLEGRARANTDRANTDHASATAAAEPVTPDPRTISG